MASTTATATIYVDATKNGDGTSWANAYKYLQDALADANASPDDIWVADGTYKPTTGSDRTASFQLINGVGVYGGFAGGESTLDERDWQTNVTILSGDIGTEGVNGDNSYHVVTGSGTDGTTVLDGFTITAGNANEPYPSTNGRGGGMYNDSGSPMVVNCTFSRNSAVDVGGGMFNYNNSGPTVMNCTFSGNSAAYDGGGMDNENSSPMVSNCAFIGNSADDGGGMCNANESSSTVTNCTFSGNSATYSGGGMWNMDGSDPNLTNCTFTGNSAEWGGGMTNYDNSSPTLTNCILWGNTASVDGNEIALESSSTIDVNYCDIQGGEGDIYNDGSGTVNWGSGNINTGPLFVDANGADGIIGTEDDNLRLSFGSPCIDAGDNNSVPADILDLDNDGNTVEPIPFDLDGRPRFADGDCNDTVIVDMGAYEFSWVSVGDFAGGCDVDFVDFTYLALTWLKEDGDLGYDYLCDISIPADSVIDERDLKIFTDNWLAGK